MCWHIWVRLTEFRYRFNLITTTKGVGIDSGPNYNGQLARESLDAAVAAGITEEVASFPFYKPGTVGATLYQKGWDHPIADDGSWTVPADLVPPADL